MKGSNGKNKAFSKELFKMAPPVNGWNRLDADLERSQVIMYKRLNNRLRLLSIGLAFLLVSFVTFYFLSPKLKSENATKETSNNKNIELSQKVSALNSTFHASNLSDNFKKTNTNSISENFSSAPKIQSEKEKTVKEKSKNGVLFRYESSNAIGISQNKNKLNQSEEASAMATLPIMKSSNAAKYNADEEVNSSERNLVATASQEKSNTLISNTTDKPASKLNEEIDTDSQRNNETKYVSTTATDASKDLTSTSGLHNFKDSIYKNASKGFLSGSSRWSISFSYSPNYTRNHLTNNSSKEYDATDYTEREKPLYSYGAGLTVRYQFNDKWSTSVGGVFSTMVYSIMLPTIYARPNENNEVHYVYPTSCGVIEMPHSSKRVIHPGDSLTEASCNQELQFIAIPILARYSFNHKCFSFYGQGGFTANIMLQAKADVMVPKYKKPLNIINNITGLKKMNYGYLFGAGVDYRIFNGISIFIEPTFRGSITSLTEDMEVNCYPYSFGANMGVTLRF